MQAMATMRRSEIDGEVWCEGRAVSSAGLLRSELGRMTLTSTELRFSARRTSFVIALADLAWVQASQRTRQAAIELTTRSSLVYRVFVDSLDWVEYIQGARSELGLQQTRALAS